MKDEQVGRHESASRIDRASESTPTPTSSVRTSTGTDQSSPRSTKANALVVDASPLSLLATAGVLDAQGYQCVCARTKKAAIEALRAGVLDLIVFDVGDDAAQALDDLAEWRSLPDHGSIPAILIADAKWSGLEQKTESLPTTRCLFKPIDHQTLIAVAEGLLWLPGLVDAHRRRGSRPSRPGWVSL